MKYIQKFFSIFKAKLKQAHSLLPKNKVLRIFIYVIAIIFVLAFSLYLWAFMLTSALAVSIWGFFAAIITPIITWLLGIMSALGITSLITAIYGFFAGIVIFIINLFTAMLAWLGSTYLGAFFLQIHGWIMPLISKVMPFVSAGKFSRKAMKFIKRAHKTE
ncbi:MAG: hypothetical protein VX730_05735 [Pseudomonadota bacterium]|nr:hypothetical protein [Pseudomonadota bacterium]